ncbi:Alpha/Beta hydrolase protein [Phaeosphaeria sp. MPI-PUGE-AT-0046c]|nr:Alpha/Beta hydrolase protein [Phaeosphaeria sp. MPI-PUGE-AT-0046c]
MTKPKGPPSSRTPTQAAQNIQGAVVHKSSNIGTTSILHQGISKSPSRVQPLREAAVGSTVQGQKPSLEPYLRVQSKKPELNTPDYAITPGDSQTFTLPDGRKLGYAVYGSKLKTATIVYYFHGTPGSRLDILWASEWGIKNNYTFICPERPGFGLSTLKRFYTVHRHAEDVQLLAQHLGSLKFKLYGVSGGGPYALALAHVAKKTMVTGVLLVTPSTPADGSRLGGKTGLEYYQVLFMPWWLERKQRRTAPGFFEWVDRYAISSPEVKAEFHALQRSKKKVGTEFLKRCASHGLPGAWIADLRAQNLYWGFELSAVEANKVVIYAGGMDTNTSLQGARQMHKELATSNCVLHEFALENHGSLQINQFHLTKQSLLNL